MPLISIQNASKSYDAELILENVTFQVNEGEKIGVVGPNGSGKTTLFRLILGDEVPDSGDVSKSRGLRIGYLEQHNVFDGKRTVIDETLQAFESLHAIEEELRDLEARMADEKNSTALDRLMRRHAELHDEFDRQGGWSLRPKAEEMLLGLGLGAEFFDRMIGELSGGEAGRVALAKLLLSEADVFLLDEPTNHLDVVGCEWLEEYLAHASKTYLVISHDRYFLDRVTNETLEIEDGVVTLYPGNYKKYELVKAEQRKAYEREYDQQLDFIRKERDFIRKHMGSQRSREAKGRLRRLERLERMAAPPADREAMKMRMKPRRPIGQIVANIEGLEHGFGDRTLFSGFDLQVLPRERVGIVGPNGTGKSTILKILLGKLAPRSGKAVLGAAAEVGYYDQMHANIDRDSTVFDEIAAGDLNRTDLEVRSYLARFLFFEEDLEKPVSALSGGERGRLSLAKLLLTRPNVLVLDEPTNHLDVSSRQALEEALESYGGTIITVSHDRYFLDKICDKIVYLDGTAAKVYLGNYTYASEKRHAVLTEAASVKEAEKLAEREREKKRKAAQAPPQKNAKPKIRSIQRIEADLSAREEEKSKLLEALGTPTVYLDPPKLRDANQKLEAVRAAIKALEAEWERAAEDE